MQIVLVDDNEEFRSVMAQLLSRAGHRVRVADSAKSALRLLREAPAGLLITDIIMPDEDGLELIIKLRAEFPNLALIAISGAGLHAVLYLRIAGKLGAAATFQKPFSTDELLVAIARIELERSDRPGPGERGAEPAP